MFEDSAIMCTCKSIRNVVGDTNVHEKCGEALRLVALIT